MVDLRSTFATTENKAEMNNQLLNLPLGSIIKRSLFFIVLFIVLLLASTIGNEKGSLRNTYASFFQYTSSKIYGGKEKGKEFQFLPYHKEGSQFDTIIRMIDHKEISRLKKEMSRTGKSLNYKGQALPVDSFVMSLLHILTFIALIAVSPIAWWQRLLSILLGSLLIHIYHIFSIRFYLNHLVNEASATLVGSSSFFFDMIKHPGLSLMLVIFLWFVVLFLFLVLARSAKQT